MLVPQAVFDQHIIVLGKTRSGKSSAMRLLVEHLLAKSRPVTIIDPKGDWWGLKASGDGREAGYPVIIFGGEHADVPLNSRAGTSVAELTATGNRPCVVDLGGWMPSARTEFWIDFASSYFRAARGRRWLVIDEVHNLCPKGKIMDPNSGKMLHWSNRLASEGLGKGISLIAASQRPQKVHNDFLTSCETLLAMRVIHKADRDALAAWVDGCGDREVGRELLNTIAGMKRGEGWVWSPEAGFGPKRLQFPMFETYDSFKAQAAHQEKLPGWASVDLTEVRTKLEKVVKEAEANDPKKLRQRIFELERELRLKKPTSASQPGREELERRLTADAEQIRSMGVELRELRRKWGRARILVERVKIASVNAMDALADEPQSQAPAEKPPRLKPVVLTPPAPRRVSGDGATGMERPNTDDDLSGPERRILKALAEIGSVGIDEAPRAMVAGWASYSASGGAFINPLGRLRTRGLVAYPRPGSVSLTGEGKAAAAAFGAVPPTRAELLTRLESICTGPEWKILFALVELGGTVERTALAKRAGYSPDGGAFANPLGSLRTKGLIEYPQRGVAQLSDWMQRTISG